MARIKIADISKNIRVSKEDMKKLSGGGGVVIRAWIDESFKIPDGLGTGTGTGTETGAITSTLEVEEIRPRFQRIEVAHKLVSTAAGWDYSQ